MRIKGMWTDGSPKNNPIDETGLTTRQNKNILITDKFGSVSNDKGFETFSDFHTKGNQPIGNIVIDNNRVVIFSIAPNGDSEIGVLDANGQYKQIVKDDLGFNAHFPIHGEYTINYKNQVVITWTDGNVSPKVLNIDDPDIDDIDLFNVTTTPILLNSVVNDTGGTLASGAYYPIFRLLKDDNSTTQWFYDYSPIYLYRDSSMLGKDQIEGSPSGETTSKSITLDLLITDTKYTKVEVGYIYVSDRIRTAYSFDVYNIDQSQGINNHFSSITRSTSSGLKITVKITNTVNATPVDLTEVLVKSAAYSRARLMTSDQNTLLLGGLDSYAEPDNLQAFFNNLILNWQSEKYDLTNQYLGDEFHRNNSYNKGFAHGEVYAFYGRVEFKWGWSKWYVLNGRLLTNADRGSSGKDFIINDTPELTVSTSTYARGHFGAWENQDESYPTTGNFPTGKVRHFKFPSHQWFRQNVYNDSEYGVKYTDKLGVFVTNLNLNSIQDCEGNSPISFELGYAKRNSYNNLVQGQTPVLVRKGYNFSSGVFDEKDIRLYPFEMLYSKSSIVTNGLSAEYVLESVPTSKKGSDLNSYRALMVIDYTKTSATSIAIGPRTVLQNGTFKFVPGNVNDSIDSNNNLLLEEYLKLTNHQTFFDSLIGSIVPIPVSNTQLPEKTVLVTLLNIKDNMYLNFDDQEIVSTSFILKSHNSGSIIFGGDTFVCDYTFHSSKNEYPDFTLDVEDHSKNNTKNGVIVMRRVLVESQYNINLRYVNLDQTFGYTEYYPKSGDQYATDFDRSKRINAFELGYNTDYNDLFETASVINNNVNINTYVDQFKIIKSQPYSKETNNNNWRYFKENDYFVIEKNKGKLINLVFARDWLYIHTEKCLFRTRSRNSYQVNSEGEEIYVGSGNIFDSEPYPVIHSELGELGTQHKFSCKITKYGYLFCDAEKGKWFLINDKVNELSEKGMHNFFINNLETIGDNPYLGNSIQSVWDERFRRFIISRKYKKLSENDQKKFKGVWSNDPNFLNSLSEGDIVYYQGKYVRYNPQ